MSQFLGLLTDNPNLLQAIGVLGFVLYVGGFFLVQNGSVCGNGVLYPLSKVVAAGCVLISLVAAFNLASFLIQVSYIGIGLYGVAMRWRRVRSNRVIPNHTSDAPAHARLISTNLRPQPTPIVVAE